MHFLIQMVRYSAGLRWRVGPSFAIRPDQHAGGYKTDEQCPHPRSESRAANLVLLEFGAPGPSLVRVVSPHLHSTPDARHVNSNSPPNPTLSSKHNHPPPRLRLPSTATAPETC